MCATPRLMLGHLRTVAPYLDEFGLAAPPSAPHDFDVWVDDPVVGRVPLGVAESGQASSRELLVLVHGLGGSASSHYVRAAERAATAAGLAVARVSLRGADRRGVDYYHAGLWTDLARVLEELAVPRVERVYVLGFSLGGHVVLRWLAAGAPSRVVAAAAICPPLDLERSAAAFDGRILGVYRRHVFRGLKAMLEACARTNPRVVPLPMRDARAIDSIREWDERIVAVRHGFRGASDYYERESAGPRLGRIALPTRLVVGALDPMVPLDVVEPSFAHASPSVQIDVVRDGGHVGFSPRTDLGERAPLGVEAQLVAYFRRQPSRA